MIAISRTVRDGLMSAFEFLCIVERDGGLVYVAMPNGRMPPTDFTLTKIGADEAVFENPDPRLPQDDPLRQAAGWRARSGGQRREGDEAIEVSFQTTVAEFQLPASSFQHSSIQHSVRYPQAVMNMVPAAYDVRTLSFRTAP